MKKICLSLLSVGLLSSTLLAETPVDAQLIVSTVSAPIDKKLNRPQLGIEGQEGSTLTYLINLPNIVSIDEESLNLAGWSLLKRQSRFSSEVAVFKLYNKFYQGNISELKLDGSITINVGSEPLTKTITIKKADQPLEFPDFNISHFEKINAKLHDGIQFKGTINMLKSIKVENDGKEIKSSGSSSGNHNSHIYFFPELNDNSKITITYYSKLKKKIVKLTK
mgnify:CR=1 FL=1